VSEHSIFTKEYFEGKDSHFSKMGGFELLIKLNQWRLKKFRIIIKKYAENHKTLLDIGCGYGHFLDLLKNDFEVYGTDINLHATKITRYKVKCPVKEGNLEKKIPFKKKFDIITALDVIEHLNKPKQAIENVYNHLKNNGLFFFQVPTVSNKMSRIINKLFFAHDKTHIYIVSVEEIEQLITSIGFKKLAIYSSLTPIFTKHYNWVRNLCYIFGVFKKS